jgi:hypothetical protein
LLVVMRSRIWKLRATLLVMGGCAGGGPPRLTAPGATEVARPEGLKRCSHWIVGAAAATAEQRIVVLAGGYGTAEAPRFAGDLACQLGAKRPVLLALEWPRQLASTINLFLSGSGSAESTLRADALWTDETTRGAGRSTAAMWELLAQLKQWRAAGLEVRVVPFGANPVSSKEGGVDYQPDDRSEPWYQQSELASALRRDPDAAVVLWVDEEDGAHTPGGSNTLAARLLEQAHPLRSFKLETPSAAAASAAAAPSLVPPAPWSLELRTDVPRFDGVFRLGATSPSPNLIESNAVSNPRGRD